MKKILLALISSMVFTTAAIAGPGHSHDEPAAPTASNPIPKLQAHSEIFEIVGMVEGSKLRLFLDDYATNAPIPNARIEIEASSTASPAKTIKTVVQTDATGEALVSDVALANPAPWSFVFTIAKADKTDLLSADIDLSAPKEVDAAHVDEPTSMGGKFGLWPWGLLVLAVLVVLVMAVRRRLGRTTAGATTRSLIITLALGCAAAIDTKTALAHGDHAAPVVQVSGTAPRRQSDGSVFLPKVSQRQLEVRTQLAEVTKIAPTVELNGRVIADPGAGGRVQATQTGRLAAPARGLPSLGQRVVQGEILGTVTPVVAPPELAGQKMQSAEARIALDLARTRLARLEQLEGSVPQRDIDTARAEVTTLQVRIRTVEAGLNTTEPLRAPASGVIAAVNVVAGQVVAANEILFEIVDPTRLRVEALAYDATLAADLKTANASTTSGASMSLTFVGAGRVLREQAVPIQFRIASSSAPMGLAVGQPVVVRAQRASATLEGIRIPAAAIVKSPSNLDIVWVHTDAEVSVPRPVQWQSIDGSTLAVTQGLKPGDRVVVRAAPLLNQVR